MGHGPYETATEGLTLLAESPPTQWLQPSICARSTLCGLRKLGPGATTRAGQLCCLMVGVPSDQLQIAGDEGDGLWVRVPGRKFVGTQTGFS
jgi:hypothetical protein